MDNVADDVLANCRTVALLNLRMWGFVFILEIGVQHDWTRWCRRCNVPRQNSRNVFLPNIESEINTQREKLLRTDRLKCREENGKSKYIKQERDPEYLEAALFGSTLARTSQIRRGDRQGIERKHRD